MNDANYRKLLKEVDFEYSLDELKKIMNIGAGKKLFNWISKYKINLRKYSKMCIDYNQFILYPSDFEETDPRFNTDILYLKDNAPDEAKKLLDIETDYLEFEQYIPDIEFTSEALNNG